MQSKINRMILLIFVVFLASFFSLLKYSATIKLNKKLKIEVNERSDNYAVQPICYHGLEELDINSNSTNYKLKIDLNLYEIEDIEKNLRNYSIKLGGKFKPNLCESKQKIAIIIPYRDRLSNLKLYLSNMHKFLSNQNIEYGIYLVEPLANLTFNRGLLMNIGFYESMADTNGLWNCFIFHDVDMLPEDIRNVYKCDNDIPVHYAVAVSKFGYQTNGYWAQYFGGINAFTKEQFLKINGFSNLYFGWGAEDDDLAQRTYIAFGKFRKRPSNINRYFMNEHKAPSVVNSKRVHILNELINKYKSEKSINEGLNTLKYKIKRLVKYPLYMHIIIDHPSSEIFLNKSKIKF